MTDMTWTRPEYETVVYLLRTTTGLTLSRRSPSEIEASIGRAMKRQSVSDLRDYLQSLQAKKIPLDDLVDELTIGETYFFREPAQFQFIRTEVLPEIRRLRGDDHTVRMWSAGCASGEEPYSLAILLEQEGLAEQGHILATDISRAALSKCLNASYRPWSLRGADDYFISKYFNKNEDSHLLLDRLKRRVNFEYLNLATDVYPSFAKGIWAMDVILCRNVLIYFDKKAIEYVARQFFETLTEDGWLITGPSDPPMSDYGPFQSVVTDAGVFWRRRLESNRIFMPSSVDIANVTIIDPEFKSIIAEAMPSSEWIKSTPTDAVLSENIQSESASAHEPGTPANSAKVSFSERDYKSVVQLTQSQLDDPHACALRVRALANLRGAAEAEDGVVAALKRHPLSAELHFLRTLLLLNLGNDQDASKEVNQVIYLDRTLLIAHYTQGLIYQRLQDMKTASKAFRNVVELGRGCQPDDLVALADGEKVGRLIDAANAELAILKDA